MMRIRGATVGLLAANLCIQLGMLPVVLWNFNGGSPWFLLNLVWLPVLALWVLPACLAGMLLSPVWETAATALFLAAQVPVSLLFNGLDWLQQAGWLLPHIALRPHWLSIAGYWVVLVASSRMYAAPASGASSSGKGSWRGLGAGSDCSGRRSAVCLGMVLGCVLLCLPLAGRMLHASGGTVSLTLLDVGQGQSVLITLPQERRILIDGGGFGVSGFDTGKSIVTPVVTRSMPPRLDVIANTHPDTDHLQGLLFPLRYIFVGRFAGDGHQSSRTNAQSLQQALGHAGLSLDVLSAGDTLFTQGEVSLEVLYPAGGNGRASSNNAALVMRLVRNGHGLALLMGDLEAEGIRALLKSGSDLSADVLVLPHHGSRSSLVPQLYDAVRPKIALAATGYLNQWKFPSDAVRQELAARDIPLFHTAENGQVQVVWRRGEMSGVEPEMIPFRNPD